MKGYVRNGLLDFIFVSFGLYKINIYSKSLQNLNIKWDSNPPTLQKFLILTVIYANLYFF